MKKKHEVWKKKNKRCKSPMSKLRVNMTSFLFAVLSKISLYIRLIRYTVYFYVKVDAKFRIIWAFQSSRVKLISIFLLKFQDKKNDSTTIWSFYIITLYCVSSSLSITICVHLVIHTIYRMLYLNRWYIVISVCQLCYARQHSKFCWRPKEHSRQIALK